METAPFNSNICQDAQQKGHKPQIPMKEEPNIMICLEK
jgi:hypothetical protein